MCAHPEQATTPVDDALVLSSDDDDEDRATEAAPSSDELVFSYSDEEVRARQWVGLVGRVGG